MKRWDRGSELRIMDQGGKVIFASVFVCLFVCLFLFAVIHPTCKHVLRKESTIKRSVDDLEIFDDQRRKSADFLSSPFSPVKHRRAKAMML